MLGLDEIGKHSNKQNYGINYSLKNWIKPDHVFLPKGKENKAHVVKTPVQPFYEWAVSDLDP